MKLGRSTFALLVAVVATLGVSASATAIGTPSPSPPVSTINGVTVHTVDSIKTSAELDAFLLSATPKTVQVDAATGKVTSVTQGAPMMTQSVTVTNTCDTSKQSCLFAASVPYANNGFSGIATKTGS